MKIIKNLLIAVALLVPTLSIASESALILSTQGNNTSYFPSLTSRAFEVCENNKLTLVAGLTTAALIINGVRQLDNQLTSYEKHVSDYPLTLSYYNNLEKLEGLEFPKLVNLNEKTTSLINLNTSRMQTSPLHFFTKPFKWIGDWLYNEELQSITENITKINEVKKKIDIILNTRTQCYKKNIVKIENLKNNPHKSCEMIKAIEVLNRTHYFSKENNNNFTQLIKEEYSKSIDAALFKNCNFVSQNLKECLDSLSKELQNSLGNLKQLVDNQPYFPKARLIIFAQDMIKDFEKSDNDSLNVLAKKMQYWHSRTCCFFKNFSDDIKVKISKDKFLDHLAGILAKKITSKNIDLSKIDLDTKKNLNTLLFRKKSLLNPLIKIITDDIKTNGNTLHKSSALLLLLNQCFDRINTIKNNDQNNAPEIDTLQKKASIVVDCIQKHSFVPDEDESAVSILYLECISTVLDIMDYLSTHVTESNQKIWKDAIVKIFNQTNNLPYRYPNENSFRRFQFKCTLPAKIIENILNKTCLLHTRGVFDEKEKSNFLYNFYYTLYEFHILSYRSSSQPPKKIFHEYIDIIGIAQKYFYATDYKKKETVFVEKTITEISDLSDYFNEYNAFKKIAEKAMIETPNLMPESLVKRYLKELNHRINLAYAKLVHDKLTDNLDFETLRIYLERVGITVNGEMTGTDHCLICRQESTLKQCEDCTAAKLVHDELTDNLNFIALQKYLERVGITVNGVMP